MRAANGLDQQSLEHLRSSSSSAKHAVSSVLIVEDDGLWNIRATGLSSSAAIIDPRDAAMDDFYNPIAAV
jgi:hypothetical protein